MQISGPWCRPYLLIILQILSLITCSATLDPAALWTLLLVAWNSVRLDKAGCCRKNSWETQRGWAFFLGVWTSLFLWCMLPNSHGSPALTTFGPALFQNGFSQSLSCACLEVLEEPFSPFLVAFSRPAPDDTHFPTRVRHVSSELFLLTYFLTSWRQHVPG